MKFKNLGKIIFIISAVIFLVNASIIYPEKLLLINFIPLSFGVLSLIFLPKIIYAGPGLSISFLVMVLRYILSSFLLSISSYSLYFDNYDDNAWITFGLMIIEMIVILIMVRKLSSKTPSNFKRFEIKDYSYIIPVVFLLISIIWSLSDPIPLSRYNFILSSKNELINTDLSESDIGLPRILKYTHYFIIISLLFFFYKVSIKRDKAIVFLWGFFIVTVLTLFYIDTSRNSMLIPLLTVLFIGIKSHPKYKKIIFSSLSIVVVLSMTFLSFMKFFNSTEIEKELISKEISAKYLNDYFGGYYEVFLGVEYSQPIKDKINNKTILNDVFGNVPYFNRFMDLENRSSNFYNQTAYNGYHIFPTVGQGFCYFGFLFSWVFTFIVFRFIFIFDNLFFKSKRMDFAFIYGLTTVSLGWLHPGSIVIASSILVNFTLLYLIVLFSSYIDKKLG